MADKFLLIAITPEEITPDEPLKIAAVLEAGWDIVHLRHPNASYRDMRNLIEAVPQKFHRRLRLHGHFALLNEFNLGGIHLNRRCPELPANFSGKFSCSCHSVDEVKRAAQCDYVTLSPVFDSISKEGYKAKFSEKEIIRLHETRGADVITSVVALGGITPDKLKKVKELNMNGAATLGYLMEAEWPGEFHERLAEFNNEYKNLK